MAVSREFDTLNGTAFTSSHVFAEVMRIYEDIGSIYGALNLQDRTNPLPKAAGATANDSYQTALVLLEEIQRLQRYASIPNIDLTDFYRIEPVESPEVFMSTQIVLAELQTLKAYLGLFNTPTPFAEHYEGKKPEDVNQMIRWCYLQLKKIAVLRSSQ